MPATWFYVVGGIVIGLLVFTIAYHLISVSIIHTKMQDAISSFNSFHSDLETVCLQEINNSMLTKFKVPEQVRVIYATNDTLNPPQKVIENITNEDMSQDFYLCLQFFDEPETLRCKKLTCNTTIPYMGSLPESEDIELFVKRILGQAPVKEYSLILTKTKGDEVEVTIGEELE